MEERERDEINKDNKIGGFVLGSLEREESMGKREEENGGAS